jgi:hypothetical protein
VDWRLRTDISEGNYRLVSVNNVALDSAFNDTTEETIAH